MESKANDQAQSMSVITNTEIEKYLCTILPARDEVLQAMEQEAARREIPIVGPVVGRLLYQLAQIARAQTVFELGSAIGYSTVWWARAVGEAGRVVYTDSSQKNADEAQRYFERAGVARRVEIRVGDALEMLSEERPDSYDIIFNDVDKEDYPRVLPLAAPRIRRGGLLIADNALWQGNIADLNVDDADTKGVREFNRLLYASPEFFTTIIPVRDGVAIAQRK
jgi:predicted O-methyltransferase YrrM